MKARKQENLAFLDCDKVKYDNTKHLQWVIGHAKTAQQVKSGNSIIVPEYLKQALCQYFY